MRKRRPNYRLVKIHRSYTVEEIARLFGTHKNTVRAWVKAGLPTCDGKRPTLILGRDLAAYLRARRTRNKRPCKSGEIYCVRCRAPKWPAGDMAEYHPITASLGDLIGICPDCEGMIYRRASRSKLSEIQGKLDITFSEAARLLSAANRQSRLADLRHGKCIGRTAVLVGFSQSSHRSADAVLVLAPRKTAQCAFRAPKPVDSM